MNTRAELALILDELITERRKITVHMADGISFTGIILRRTDDYNNFWLKPDIAGIERVFCQFLHISSFEIHERKITDFVKEGDASGS